MRTPEQAPDGSLLISRLRSKPEGVDQAVLPKQLEISAVNFCCCHILPWQRCGHCSGSWVRWETLGTRVFLKAKRNSEDLTRCLGGHLQNCFLRSLAVLVMLRFEGFRWGRDSPVGQRGHSLSSVYINSAQSCETRWKAGLSST